MTLGTALDPNATEDALYWNPFSACSPLSTAGNVIVAVTVLPAASLTATVASTVPAAAASGVPLITPLLLISSPDGRSVALYSSMPLPPEGLIALIASPTFKDAGAV